LSRMSSATEWRSIPSGSAPEASGTRSRLGPSDLAAGDQDVLVGQPEARATRYAATGTNGTGRLGQLRDGPAVRPSRGGSSPRGRVPDRRHVCVTHKKPATRAGFVTP